MSASSGNADLPTSPTLQLSDVRAGYERVEVLRGVTLAVPPATVVALLGPNGAGKTTLMRVISGVLPPWSGDVVVEGRNVTMWRSDQRARVGICTVPEGRGVFPALTVAENLRMWTFRGGLKRSEVEAVSYERFPVLSTRRKQLAGTLSGGEQQMLALSRALATNPRLLLLDELSMGLAPLVVGRLFELVAQIAAEGYSILMVEQFVHTALSFADQGAIMVRGEIVMRGGPDDVRSAAADIYLRRPTGASSNEEDTWTCS